MLMNLTNFRIQGFKPIIYDRVVRGKTWTEIAKKYNGDNKNRKIICCRLLRITLNVNFVRIKPIKIISNDNR